MRIFTVHLPSTAGAGGPGPALERAEFVRDGFHFWAFLLGPLWCLWRGLWVPALAILVLGGALLGIGHGLHLSSDTRMLAQLVLAFVVGLEAPNLRRFGLRRHGYADAGLVAAHDLTQAESIFFARAAAGKPAPDAPPPHVAVEHAFLGRGHGSEDVVGLFPEPRGR